MKKRYDKKTLARRIIIISSSLLLGSILILIFPGLLSTLINQALSLGLFVAALETVEKFAMICFLSLSLMVLNREKIVAILTEARMSQISRSINQPQPAYANRTCRQAGPQPAQSTERQRPPAGEAGSPDPIGKEWKKMPVDWKPFEYNITSNTLDALGKPTNYQSLETQEEDELLVEHKIWQD